MLRQKSMGFLRDLGYEKTPTQQTVTRFGGNGGRFHSIVTRAVAKFSGKKPDYRIHVNGTHVKSTDEGGTEKLVELVTVIFSSKCSPRLTDIQEMESKSFIFSLQREIRCRVVSEFMDDIQGTYQCSLKKQ